MDLTGMDLKHNGYSEVVTHKESEIKVFVQLILLRCVRKWSFNPEQLHAGTYLNCT